MVPSPLRSVEAVGEEEANRISALPGHSEHQLGTVCDIALGTYVALDFTNSGPVAGAAVVKAVKIPVVGMGGIATGEDAAEFMIAGAAARR